MENTWKLAREVSDRIHDEPGPGKHDFLISVSSYSKKQQILHFLACQVSHSVEEGTF